MTGRVAVGGFGWVVTALPSGLGYSGPLSVASPCPFPRPGHPVRPYLGDAHCSYPSGICAPQLVLLTPGNAVHVGPQLPDIPVAIRLTARNELLVATTGNLLRIDPVSGVVLAAPAIPVNGSERAIDVDSDSTGCTGAVALSTRILLVELCASDPAWSDLVLDVTSQKDGDFQGVRFARNGDLFVLSRALRRVDRHGSVKQTWSLSLGGSCAMDIDDAERYAVLGCGTMLSRLDLTSGAMMTTQAKNAQYIRGVSIRREARPSYHRRAAKH